LAVTPHGAATAKDKKDRPLPYLRLHLVFAADGRLTERQIVQLPKGEAILRQVCEADGTVRLLDKEGKELHVRRGKLSVPVAPDLTVDTKNLVVFDLPYRTPDHVLRARKIEGQNYGQMRFADALPLLAAYFASGNGAEATKIFQQAFHGREQRQLGFYVLLAAAGQNLDADNLNVLAEHMDSPLAQYLALHSSPVLRKHASQWAVASTQWPEPYLQHLAVTHALLQRWQDERITKGPAARLDAEKRRAFDYIAKHKGSAFAWALLSLMQDRAGDNQQLQRELAERFRLFDDQPGLHYAARYEHARSLYKGGQREAARKAFRELYQQTLDQNVLPPLDQDFTRALVGDAEAPDLWTPLLRQTAERLVRAKHRADVLSLARQCWQLNDLTLANELVETVLKGLAEQKERVPLVLAAIAFYEETSQLPQADDLLRTLLTDAKLAREPGLWRRALKLAEQRDLTSRSLECLERALDAEFTRLPAVIDLSSVRSEYGQLLGRYEKLAEAMVTLHVAVPADFRAKVVRTADRWRALDRDAGAACTTTARVLRLLKDHDLAWDYSTTPIALQVNEATPWLQLGQSLCKVGERSLADRAYKAACAAEPTNADYLWERAQNLAQQGKTLEARALYRQIAAGQWQPRFQATRARAQALAE
jgi:tetratricopeptide (TPR) repeat protein